MEEVDDWVEAEIARELENISLEDLEDTDDGREESDSHLEVTLQLKQIIMFALYAGTTFSSFSSSTTEILSNQKCSN